MNCLLMNVIRNHIVPKTMNNTYATQIFDSDDQR